MILLIPINYNHKNKIFYNELVDCISKNLPSPPVRPVRAFVFRSNPLKALFIVHLLYTDIRRCEMDHLAACDYTRVCAYEHAQIASVGFPQPYAQRSACSWKISTRPGTYITLEFLQFDIPSLGECDSSSLTLYNGVTDNKGFELGAYCNVMKPPNEIFSDFNDLFLKFLSGAEEPGNGFLAEYEQQRRDEVPWIPPVPGMFIIISCLFCFLFLLLHLDQNLLRIHDV